jgi:hypothetical protein
MNGRGCMQDERAGRGGAGRDREQSEHLETLAERAGRQWLAGAAGAAGVEQPAAVGVARGVHVRSGVAELEEQSGQRLWDGRGQVA